MEIITLIAILVSPAIAVIISLYLQNRKERRGQKLYIFTTLIAARHMRVSDEVTRALNMIDVAFHDCGHVRDLWHSYYEMLCNEGLNNPSGWEQRNKKNLELITEMAKALGYGKAITHLDVDRVYFPTGLSNQSERADEIANELLRVLKSSSGFQLAKKTENEE